MATKKQATKTVEPPRELEKTLVVDNITYNINAVHSTEADTATTADKVVGSLTINSYEKNATSKPTKVIFNGSEDKSINIVPQTGGHFNGNITVPNITSLKNLDEKTVLNYNAIVNEVLAKLCKACAVGVWDGSKNLTFSNADGKINGFGIVKGESDKKVDFATKNTEEQFLSDFLYVCTDTGDIYIGTSENKTLTQVAVSANTATKLASKRDLKVDLASADAAQFDGSSDATAIGVSGILPVENGGTGADTASKAVNNLITNQKISPSHVQTNSNRYYHNNNYGIDLSGSDISHVNALYFSDPVTDNPDNSSGAGGIYFARPGNYGTYDHLYSEDSSLCFATAVTAGQAGDIKTLYHSGTVIPVENGGTGKTDLDSVTVGNATKLASKRDLKVDLASADAAQFDGSSDATAIGVSGTLPVKNGGTGKTDLDSVTVGKAKALTATLTADKGGTGQTNLDSVTVGKAKISNSIRVSTSKTVNAYKNAAVIVSANDPDETDLKNTEEFKNGLPNGSIWIKYS